MSGRSLHLFQMINLQISLFILLCELNEPIFSNPDFIHLVSELDKYLTITDGDEHAYYDQYNQLKDLEHVIVVYHDDVACGCGAMKTYTNDTMEIKRMFTTPESRGNGIATTILNELEKWTVELGFKTCILETGIKQTEAISLYKKRGYLRIPNYGQYAGKEISRCFIKNITTR